MKRGRKKLDAPEMFGHVTMDEAFLLDCIDFLLTDTLPTEESHPGFIRELLWRHLKSTPLRKYTGREIAAMVDELAIFYGSIAMGIELTRLHFFFQEITTEAIRQHHKRYGKSAAQLERERKQRIGQLNRDDAFLKSIHEQKLKRRAQVDQEINAWKFPGKTKGDYKSTLN